MTPTATPPDLTPVIGDIQQTPEIDKLMSALAKAQAKIEPPIKDAENPHYHSRYADLASNFDACRKVLPEFGLALLQPASATGKQVRVTTMLGHESGQWIRSTLTMTAVQETPQGIGGAITYGRRYGLQAMVGLAGEDDDGESAEGRGKAGQGQEKQTSQARQRTQSRATETRQPPESAPPPASKPTQPARDTVEEIAPWLKRIEAVKSESQLDSIRAELQAANTAGTAPKGTAGLAVKAALDERRKLLQEAKGKPR